MNTGEIMSYAIDPTLTLGQFIDGFNTTMAMLYGPMKSQYDIAVMAVPVYGGAHTHQVAYPNGPLGGAIATPVPQVQPWHEMYLARGETADFSHGTLTISDNKP